MFRGTYRVLGELADRVSVVSYQPSVIVLATPGRDGRTRVVDRPDWSSGNDLALLIRRDLCILRISTFHLDADEVSAKVSRFCRATYQQRCHDEARLK